MKYFIKFTSTFKKSRKLMKKRGLDLEKLDKIIEKIVNGESLPESNKNHELTGSLKGFYECHIEPDWLLIYLIEEKILTLTLINTGSHSDLFS